MRAPPIRRRDLFDAAGRPGDAGVIDSASSPPSDGFDVGEQALDVGLRGDIGLASAPRVRMRGAKFGEEVVGDVADVDPGAARDEQVADRPADARGAGGDEDAQAACAVRRRRGDRSWCAPIGHVRFSRSAMTAARTTRPKTMVRVA